MNPAPPLHAVDLYWIPLGAGAGGAVVRTSGRLYEVLAAAVGRRAPQALYHSALQVAVDGRRWAIEMAPVWTHHGARGVAVEGAVGARWLGRSRLFRYEVRCWPEGAIPDAAEAVGGPRRLSEDRPRAAAVVDGVAGFPAATWGRDEQRLGEMWNSNSLVSWLLVRSGHDLSDVGPPAGGRAPGWDAGRRAAARAG